ncbi:indole-3-glycerol phosphate synthase TrpC [Laceyella putida]|uniref:Indole-3-glycerol phosphate synthase n=1 Tax=Laceyella putida TaxID=110101 RepID=A0ABW2RM97_9BACL
MFLDNILTQKQHELARLVQSVTDEKWDQAARMLKGISLAESIKRERGLAVIAEIKPASPSKGIIREEVDPISFASAYEAGGANAISVLTDVSFFKGSNENLSKVKNQVSLPVLRKDFIIDPIQVLESKLIGADAILLIVAALDEKRLILLSETAHRLGMEVLVEIHDETEIEASLACGADVIGINNRNLETFATNLAVTERVRPKLPSELPVIGESGIHSPTDAKRMADAGVQGILVGEYLMRQADPAQALRELKRVKSP